MLILPYLRKWRKGKRFNERKKKRSELVFLCVCVREKSRKREEGVSA